MRALRAVMGVAVLLLIVLIAESGKGWSNNDAPHDGGKSSQLVSVRTYAPGEFRQSLADRLSGGLRQRFPYRIAADSQGRILVTDPGLSVVHVFDIRRGTRCQIRGDRGHRLVAPAYIAVDADDNIYLTELGQSVVVVLQPSGHFMRTIGLGILRVPRGIWVDKQSRKLYVADWIRDEILSFDLDGKLLQVFGNSGTGKGQLKHPLEVAVHGDTLVVLDAGNFRFELFDLKGNVGGIWPFGVNRKPITLGCDPAGNLYYVDLNSGGLVVMSPQGKVLAGLGQRPFGRWVPRSSAGPNYMSIALNPLGEVLALRPSLEVDVIQPITNAGKPTK